jgi:hypothetical protein
MYRQRQSQYVEDAARVGSEDHVRGLVIEMLNIKQLASSYCRMLKRSPAGAVYISANVCLNDSQLAVSVMLEHVFMCHDHASYI